MPFGFRYHSFPSLLSAITLFLFLLVGCDGAGVKPSETGQFVATIGGVTTAEFRGEAVHEFIDGDGLLEVFTTLSIRLTDRDWSRTRRGIYFSLGDSSALAEGIYPLLDFSSPDRPLSSGRMWAYVGGKDEDFAYSRGGELRIVEMQGNRVTGTFQFPAAPLSDSTDLATITVEGTFESLRR